MLCHTLVNTTQRAYHCRIKMAAARRLKCFQQNNCLLSAIFRSKLGRSDVTMTSVSSYDRGKLWTANRTFCSSSKETPNDQKDPKDQPIRFSTSKARHMTLNQTLGYGADMNKNSSKKSIYAGLIGMAVMTYIIFFLPADKDDELELLEAEIAKGQNQGR